ACLRRRLRTPSSPCRFRSPRGCRRTSRHRLLSPATWRESPPPSSGTKRASSARPASVASHQNVGVELLGLRLRRLFGKLGRGDDDVLDLLVDRLELLFL